MHRGLTRRRGRFVPVVVTPLELGDATLGPLRDPVASGRSYCADLARREPRPREPFRQARAEIKTGSRAALLTQAS
jgi:hypothetical protein